MFGLGITSPTANILQFLVAGDVKYINWGVFLVLGISWGHLLQPKRAVNSRVRAADAQTTLRSGLGGVLMGFGASIAGGCSIGNGLVMTAMMTWQGWIGLVFMILGVGPRPGLCMFDRSVRRDWQLLLNKIKVRCKDGD